MKRARKYLNKRQKKLFSYLETPRQSYTQATFHKLRVEIKKIDACFHLINFCSAKFKRKKTFEPFKAIFKQAGRIRELQVEENILKKYFAKNNLENYRILLKQLRLKRQVLFFLILDKINLKDLQHNFRECMSDLKEVNQKKINQYFTQEAAQLQTLLD